MSKILKFPLSVSNNFGFSCTISKILRFPFYTLFFFLCSYFMISPTSQQTRAYHWLSKHAPAQNSVLISDVTSMYTALNVMGPKAEGLLSELTDTNMSKQAFHSMTCQEINLGNASGIKAMRLTHTGEDGFMLYIPSEVSWPEQRCRTKGIAHI